LRCSHSGSGVDHAQQTQKEENEKQEEQGDEASDEQESAAEFGILQPVFQPYFPEWQTVYARPKRHARPGTHIFKATLTGWRGGGGGIWRLLAVPADATLEDLAEAILEAFKLDNDHLYDFRYRDERGRQRQYNHSYTDEGPYLHEITVGESELPLKGEMDFTFDYGDYWRFKVRLEKIDLGSTPVGQPKVIEFTGEPPPQYPPAE
jgi:Plasmid pRiA4b ORF-3-like protein